eukprot:1304534-Rhodomonas_salina.2
MTRGPAWNATKPAWQLLALARCRALEGRADGPGACRSSSLLSWGAGIGLGVFGAGIELGVSSGLDEQEERAVLMLKLKTITRKKCRVLHPFLSVAEAVLACALSPLDGQIRRCAWKAEFETKVCLGIATGGPFVVQ